MASILILNTAIERACALVWRDSGHAARHAPEARQSAQTILKLAREALDETGLKRADAVAVVAGPGSFTGTRIGVAAAQGSMRRLGCAGRASLDPGADCGGGATAT